MSFCPRCKIELEGNASNYGRVMLCRQCHGLMLNWPQFKRSTNPILNKDLWMMATSQNVSGGECSECGAQMKKVVKDINGLQAILNICTHCQMVWIDGEDLLNTLEALPPTAKAPRIVSPEIQQKMIEAVEEIKYVEKKESKFEYLPDGLQVQHLGSFFVVAEARKSRFRRFPYMTYLILAIVTIVSAYVLVSGHESMAFLAFGYMPSEGLRYGGITMLTSFFLHGNYEHLIGNMYVLWVFGKNVENRLGWFIYLVLLFASTLVGHGLHAMFSRNMDIISIGASGGIAGVLIFYSLNFYREKLLIFMIPIPAILVGVLWFGLQLIGAADQIEGTGGGVNYLAHVGGAIIGILVWFMLRNDKERLAQFND